jgi:argininosuccinate lyase
MKLWQKANTTTSQKIEAFTVGKDRELDLQLAEFDVLGSLAHTRMLESIGLLSAADLSALQTELKNLYREVKAGNFVIEEGVEDVHSQVELMLTRKLGEAGKKIHSGRSRNDQVLVDLKLYTRDRLQRVATETKRLFDLLIQLSERHKEVLLPGYTHLQIAMPSSFGLWFGAYAESLVDDLIVLHSAYQISNKNPLGSGAGYGSSFPLNRTMTTQLLGFQSLHYNAVYAQMSRGKTEQTACTALAAVATTLSRLAMDVCLYNSQNFGFLTLPDELTTGSSIMPHKKNPDVAELLRARTNRLKALPNEFALMLTNLPSGYHRDLQLTKEILMPAFDEIMNCLDITHFMLENIRVNQDIMQDGRYDAIFSVERVNELVLQGVPFREAYRQTGHEIAEGTYQAPKELHHTHEGSLGNLCNEQIKGEMERVYAQFNFNHTEAAIRNLIV